MSDSKNKAKSIEDIAKECEVSASTVSRVLNNEPGISAETRQKVLKVVENHKFSLQKRKRPLKRSQLNLVIVVPEEEELSVNPFFNISELLGAINEAFQEEKKRVEVVSIVDFEGYIDEERPAIDGILLVYRSISEKVRNRMKDLNIPYIFLSRVFHDDNYVSCNYYKGTLDLATLLIENGHKRIGYLGNYSNPNNIDRYRGYKTALNEASLSHNEDFIYKADSLFSVNDEAAIFFINQKCDAVICFNDYMAINLINELQKQGKIIPDHISVTGFDDSPLSKVYKPAITTIQQPTFEMSFLASRWLRDNILNRKSRDLRIEVDGRLIRRESVVER